ncbi:MAG: hypothetical protein V7K25_12305 [Nostoc sp.]|uniref:hypothetical protein n=1 Tax=Nostoc sp. TaxID=1180 RepID=UPI002FF504BE
MLFLGILGAPGGSLRQAPPGDAPNVANAALTAVAHGGNSLLYETLRVGRASPFGRRPRCFTTLRLRSLFLAP